MVENHDVREIEANLKRMLNMGQQGTGNDQTQENAGSSDKDVKKGDKTGGDNHVTEKEQTLTPHHHQPDPGMDVKDATDQQESTPKKKKKKAKKKNKQETPEEQAALDKLTQARGQGKQGQDNKQEKEESKKKSSKDEDSEDDSDTGRPILAGLKTAIKFRYLDEKLTPAIMNELEKQKIYPMRKKSTKFPSAKYFCRLCEYHCDNIPVCRQHYNEARHKRRSEIAVQDKMLKTLPQPSKRHLVCLDSILLDLYQQYGLSDQDLQDRADIARWVEAFLHQSLPGLELRVYGSSLTGFGLKTSDLNMDLVVPDGSNPAQLLTKVYKVLNNSDVYKNVKSNFLAKVPSVLFDSPCGLVHCEISVNSDLAYYTSRLLEIYSKVDPRVRQLAVVFRYWAKLCQVDDQNKGSLPAYTYGLMTVFYLQQCQPPCLPVLWKDLSEVVLKRPKTPNDILTMLTNLELERQDWVCENTKSLGQLWVDLLLFYGVRYNLGEHVISIRQERLLLRSEKKWKTKRMAIEDPFSVKRNVARTLFSVRIFDYLYNCLRKGCLYFSLPTNQTDASLSNGKSRDKSSQLKSCQKQSSSVVPKTDNTVKEVPSQSKAFRDKRSNTESEHTHQSVNQTWSAELAETSVPDKDSKIICDILLEPESSKMSTDSITESEKVNVSNVEFALTVSGSSSDFGIKENEFLAECKDTGKESSVESDAGSNIKEHSFLSSAEVISSPDKKERLFKNTKKDESSDSSEMEEGLMKLNVKSDNITNVIETEHSEPDTEKEEHVTEYNMETDTSVRENENNVSDDIGKRDKEIVEGLQGGDEKTACDNELSFENNHFEACDNSDMVTRQDEFGAGSEVGAVSKVDAVSEVGAISELGAVGNVNTCEESGDKQVDNDHNDSECNEQENILSVYTQEENDTGNRTDSSATVNDSVKEVSEVNVRDIESDNGTSYIPEHSFLNEEVNSAKVERDENSGDAEDIIDHSFLADESALMDLLESSQDVDNESKETDNVTHKDSKELANKDAGAAMDSESGSESESDMEQESPDSSPVRRRKFERPESPENAEYDFIFSVNSLTDGKGPSVFCGICEKEGHLKSNCPEEQLPELKQLPPVTKHHYKLLTNVIKTVPDDFQLSRREIDDREAVRWGLECFLQELFPDAELSLFGSSKNGFGFHFSDLDICVTFRGRNPEDLNFVELIEALCKKLKTHKSFYNVFPITTAKVPIVKFIHRPTRLEGDISLYNILAQQNTRLLYCYSCIDPRVVTLGYAIKVFAKVCDIGDASKGSLSSYAYMLLLFHYLQHTKPPVLPVLQELRNGDEKAEFMVDGWNAWFYDDLKNLPKVWPHYRHNNQSVGELWFGLFKYYCEEFNIEEQVVTIRQSETLTKFEKLWNRKCIAIEDPFDLSHNLGAGLTRKMHKYIMTALINARELYGTSITGPPDGYNNPADYFFDQSLLAEGELPNDRLCRVCSKIGHIAKECPRVLARKEREAEERRRRDEQRKAQELREKGGTTPNRGNNQNKPKQQQRSHLGPARSLSDPVDTSPRRPQTKSHMFINRQFSAGADLQSYDSPQGYSQNPRHQGTAYNPSSPQPIPQQTYSWDRRQQGNSPRSYPQSGQPQSPRGFHSSPQGFSPGGFNTQQAGNPFQWMNQNDNSARGNFHPPIQNLASMSHMGANQNQNYIPPLMSLPNQMQGNQQNGNRGYRSSPNQKQGYQNRKQQPRSLLTNEDKELSSSTNRNQAYNRSQQQQQQQGPGSRRQVTMVTGANRSTGMGVTVNNEYYQGNKGKK